MSKLSSPKSVTFFLSLLSCSLTAVSAVCEECVVKTNDLSSDVSLATEVPFQYVEASFDASILSSDDLVSLPDFDEQAGDAITNAFEDHVKDDVELAIGKGGLVPDLWYHPQFQPQGESRVLRFEVASFQWESVVESEASAQIIDNWEGVEANEFDYVSAIGRNQTFDTRTSIRVKFTLRFFPDNEGGLLGGSAQAEASEFVKQIQDNSVRYSTEILHDLNVYLDGFGASALSLSVLSAKTGASSCCAAGEESVPALSTEEESVPALSNAWGFFRLCWVPLFF